MDVLLLIRCDWSPYKAAVLNNEQSSILIGGTGGVCSHSVGPSIIDNVLDLIRIITKLVFINHCNISRPIW